MDIECGKFSDPCEFQSAVDVLLFLEHATRPDIFFGVRCMYVAIFLAHPLQQHWITEFYGILED